MSPKASPGRSMPGVNPSHPKPTPRPGLLIRQCPRPEIARPPATPPGPRRTPRGVEARTTPIGSISARASVTRSHHHEGSAGDARHGDSHDRRAAPVPSEPRRPQKIRQIAALSLPAAPSYAPRLSSRSLPGCHTLWGLQPGGNPVAAGWHPVAYQPVRGCHTLAESLCASEVLCTSGTIYHFDSRVSVGRKLPPKPPTNPVSPAL